MPYRRLQFPEPEMPPGVADLRAEVRSFLAAQDFEPGCDSWLGGFDPGFSRAQAAKGWIGMTWPARYGGHDRSALERYVVIEELLAAGAPVSAHWIADRQTGPLLLRYGTEAQRSSLLPRIAAGECYFCLGLSEPDSGSDLASIRTSASAVEGGWRVSGTKVWTSHAHHSNYMLTLVRTSPGQQKQEGLSQLIVDLHSPGIEIHEIRLLTGEHHFNEVVLEDVFVPAEMLVGAEGNGWQQVVAELAYERSGPERFLSTYPLLAETVIVVGPNPDDREAERLGRMAARLTALRRLSLGVAAAIEAGQTPAVEASLVKDQGTRFERDLTEACRALAGGRDQQPLSDLLSEAIRSGPGFTLRGGTNEILKGIVARGLTSR